MKEEPVEPFHKIAIRLTLSGELKPFAELLSGLEYGPQQLTIPFVELTRRGAVAGAKGPRTLQGTIEVSGYLQGEQAAKAEPEPPEGEGEAPAGSLEGEGAAGAPAAEAPPGLPVAGLPGIEPAPPAASAEAPAMSAESPAVIPESPAAPEPSAAAPAPPTTTPAPAAPPAATSN